MGSRSIGSAPPPFYWKVPVPEKDYMSENYRRIRQIANQSQKKRSEPLKAAFIPGVTKNEKYAHVPSRVGEFLKQTNGTKNSDTGSEDPNPRKLRQYSVSGLNQQQVNRRLSKSSGDLRQSKPVSAANNVSHNFSKPTNHEKHPMQQPQRRRDSGEFNPPQESVYNWRFKEDVIQSAQIANTGASYSNGQKNSVIPAKYCHRVEYLPCDGICAEENFVVDEACPDSARSASSCRTSRGCNTDETRILEDHLRTASKFNSNVDKVVDNCNERSIDENGLAQKVQIPKSRSVLTLPSQCPDNGPGKSSNFVRASASQNPGSGRIKTSQSSTSLKILSNGFGGGGDVPHTLGTVPKYLKQRQEEWKIQDKEKKEAEMNANVPQGYVLLSDEERSEHLKTFKQNYDMLINDLNRIPIRIDTIRVRDHKIQLEQQLTRLEEAMKTFSRPRVWVKVDG